MWTAYKELSAAAEIVERKANLPVIKHISYCGVYWLSLLFSRIFSVVQQAINEVLGCSWFWYFVLCQNIRKVRYYCAIALKIIEYCSPSSISDCLLCLLVQPSLTMVVIVIIQKRFVIEQRGWNFFSRPFSIRASQFCSFFFNYFLQEMPC